MQKLSQILETPMSAQAGVANATTRTSGMIWHLKTGEQGQGRQKRDVADALEQTIDHQPSVRKWQPNVLLSFCYDELTQCYTDQTRLL